jgi:hypothetical protein
MIYVDKSGNVNLSKLHQVQKDFIRSESLHTGLIGGYQSGKSVAGTIKVLTKLLKNPGVPCAYYLPTYRLIADMLVPKFEKLFEGLKIPYQHLKQDNSFITKYGKIMMRSLDNPSSIVSYSVGYSIVDEFDVIPSDKMKIALGRIVSRNSFKSTTGEKNCIDFVSTPEGFGFAYKFFVKDKNDNKKLLKISTLDNAHNLADSYIQGLREAYTENQLKAYLGGEFVNLTSGTVFHSFDRTRNHTIREIEVNDVLHIGMDFNITNMSAVIHVTDGNDLQAVAEVTKAYDTADMINILNNRYPKRSLVIYPDASGDSRNTAGDSDIKLLRNAGFKVIVSRSNPKVKDRITVANAAFKNANGVSTYFVNTNNCPEYTEALEQLAYKNGVPDKDSGFDHITDGGTYCAYKIKKINAIEEWGSSKAL